MQNKSIERAKKRRNYHNNSSGSITNASRKGNSKMRTVNKSVESKNSSKHRKIAYEGEIDDLESRQSIIQDEGKTYYKK